MKDLVIIEKQVLDELIYKIDHLKSKVDNLYVQSGIAPQKWVDNRQACQRLSVSIRTLQTLRDSKTLPYTKMGGKVFYKPEDIEKMLFTGYHPIN